MTIKQWENTIKKAIKKEGHYKPIFDRSIVILSEILFERDRIYTQFIDEGAQVLIDYESDRGSQNRRPNPLLKQWQELNNTALSYMKELGLTPGGLKKIKCDMEIQSQSPLDRILEQLESESDERD
ncbi:MAG: P27 family phage terminase small subunit [Erysipelotrichaceae bacterium]|nr:P27 family phage terminase small subunit [Erysipelotrichaceae bacterium]